MGDPSHFPLLVPEFPAWTSAPLDCSPGLLLLARMSGQYQPGVTGAAVDPILSAFAQQGKRDRGRCNQSQAWRSDPENLFSAPSIASINGLLVATRAWPMADG